MNKINLKQKMTLVFSLTLVFSCLTLLGISYHNSKNSITTEIYHYLHNNAKNIANIIYERKLSKIKIVDTISQRHVIKSMDWLLQKPVLIDEAKRTGFMTLGIINPEGMAKYPDDTELYLGDREYFQKAMSGICNISDVIISRVIHKPVIVVACPIKSNNTINGVLFGRLPANKIMDFLNDISFIHNGYVYIADNKSNLIVHQRPELAYTGINIFEESKTNTVYKDLALFFDGVINKNQSIGEYHFDGQNIFAGVAKIPDSNWLAVVAAPKNSIFSHLYQLRKNLLLATTIIIVFGVIFSIYASNWIAIPIINMTNIMKSLANGDLQKPVSGQEIEDEIGNMAKTLETFRQSLLEKEVLEIKQHISINALQASEKRYRMLFSTMTEGFAVHEIIYDDNHNPCDYQFLEVNPAFEKIIGLNANDVIGKNIYDIMPQTEKIWLERYAEIVKTGKNISFEDYSQSLNKYFDVNAFKNAPNQFAVICRDITERKNYEKQIIQAKEWFSHLYNETPIMIFSINTEGNIISVNKKWEEIMGYSKKEIIGKSVINIMPKKAGEYAVKVSIPNHWKYGYTRNETHEFVKKNGEVITVILNSVATIDPMGNKMSLTTIQDITEIKAAEARERKIKEQLVNAQESLAKVENMAVLGQLVAGIAHEINTPIGTALTASSHLSEKTKKFDKMYKSGELKKSLLEDYINTSTEASNLIMSNVERAAKQIISFKQIAVDHSNQERRLFNFKDYTKEVVSSLQPRLKGTQISLKIKCPEEIEVNSYPGALFQIITNLFINSLMHGFENKKKGKIVIIITQIKNTENETTNIKMEFKDNGKGIPKTRISKIFEPFYTTKRGKGGSGLGLSIVYNIVTKTLGGDIRVSSIRNKETIFTILLPKNAP